MDEEQQKPKVSKAQQRAVNKYIKNHYDRINLTLPLGYKAKIQAAAKEGESVNAFILRAINAQLQSED